MFDAQKRKVRNSGCHPGFSTVGMSGRSRWRILLQGIALSDVSFPSDQIGCLAAMNVAADANSDFLRFLCDICSRASQSCCPLNGIFFCLVLV